ncbi:glycosyl hydrolase [Ilyonectria sp. MPI-CAGE-AT-0026]|nr:glycosyl hydrolase [Ilyonectria sp. MPI-CAGE-AT-0026]
MSWLTFHSYRSLTFLLALGQAICLRQMVLAACSIPKIALISPYECPDIGWTVHGSIAFAVDVQDTTSVSKVEFFVDDESVYTDTDYPWGFLWNTRDLDTGNYELRAIVTNSCGGYAAMSQTVTVAAPLIKAEVNGLVITSGLLPTIKPAIEGINLRDTSVTVGPDNIYYLSGTGADNDAWIHNEGINLWKSTDLKIWTYVGLIWSFERDGYEDEKTWWWYKDIRLFRAIWAPEFQYINRNFYITYSLQSKGSRLLKSTTGKPEGPYELAAGDEVNLFNNIDGGLFTSSTDSRSGYLCYENGNIVKLNTGWNATTGAVTRLNVGDEGCFVFHWKSKYYLSVAKFMTPGGRYSSYVGISDWPTGPYSQFHEAIPCGGHNTFFVDKCGTLWGTFFGNDAQAPWREQPAIVKMATHSNGTLYPDPDQTVEVC